jgi:heat shock protein HslJ
MRCSDIVVILVLAGLILAAGCAGIAPEKTSGSKQTQQTGSHVLSQEGKGSSSLVGPWYVKALIIDATPKAPVRLTGIQLTFNGNGSFSGFDSCNPYIGKWQAKKQYISISDINSQTRYCIEPEGVMEQESEYFALLKNASSYHVYGEDLVLSDGTGKNGIFLKQVFF